MCVLLHSRQVKNRYTDVLCFDHSRVTLKDSARGDYINANFVDGYKQPRAFISAQGPLPKTFEDFWQMVWEQKVLVVVMTTRAVERHRTKCGQVRTFDVQPMPYLMLKSQMDTRLRLTLMAAKGHFFYPD